MPQFLNQLLPPIIIILIIIFVICGILWLFLLYGFDKLKHPEEWKTKGSSGERIIYNTLTEKLGVPENQILRNIYIPTKSGKTSEIDLLVISRKALFVFEVKNYGGNIYGDRNRKKWIQYIGRQKNFFYNPFLQNETHAKELKKYLAKFGEIPIIPVVTTINRGNWKIKNLKPNDYLLGYNSHFKDIYENLPDSDLLEGNITKIITKLRPLSRPDQKIKDAHIASIISPPQSSKD